MIPVFRQIRGFCRFAHGGFADSLKQFEACRAAVNQLATPMIPRFDSAPR